MNADCSNGLACDPRSHTCRDELVTACGCRVVGERASSSSYFGLLGLAWLGAAQRRKRRAAPKARLQRVGAARNSGSSAPRRSSEAISS
jgi:MYXO-CTERM domain-containing protein